MVKSNCKICQKEIVKNGRLAGIYCSIQCKAEFQRQQKPVSKEWLYQMYTVNGLSANDIAVLVNRDPKRVWEWLRDLGIETRPRGSYDHPKFHYYKYGESHPLQGKTHSPETKEKIRQARYADGHVPYLKDGKPYMKGRRGCLSPAWKGGVTPERQDFYRSDEWREAVKTIWKRDDAICQKCGLDSRSGNRDFCIHHIVSFAVKELRAEVDNLILLCKECHKWVHSKKNISKELIKLK